jgi:hypothetical protein
MISTLAFGGGAHAAVVPAAVPTVPLQVTAWTGAESVKVAWSPPTSDGGNPVTSYTANVWSAPPPTGPANLVTTCTTTELGCALTGLTYGETYYVDVVATNSDGDGPASAYVTVSPGQTPSRVRNPAVIAGVGKAIVSWQQPRDFGDGTFTWYRAGAYTSSGIGAGIAANSCVSKKKREVTCTIYGLTNGETYYISVWAKNSFGSGPRSSHVKVLIGKHPGKPREVEADGRNHAGRVRWLAPTNNGGLAITSYVVRIFKSGRNKVVTKCITSGGARTCLVGGLTNGVTYQATVAAANLAGQGPQSDRDSFRPHG